jgi:hypothetical protein
MCGGQIGIVPNAHNLTSPNTKINKEISIFENKNNNL